MGGLVYGNAGYPMISFLLIELVGSEGVVRGGGVFLHTSFGLGVSLSRASIKTLIKSSIETVEGESGCLAAKRRPAAKPWA